MHTTQKQTIPCHPEPLLQTYAQRQIPGVSKRSIKTASATRSNGVIRIISETHNPNTYGKNCSPKMPFYFSKLDVKDGFWQMVVTPEDARNFTYVLPPKDSTQQQLEESELVVPEALQMGWCESPPFFCATSETARDVIEHFFDSKTTVPKHKFEHYMMPTNILQPAHPKIKSFPYYQPSPWSSSKAIALHATWGALHIPTARSNTACRRRFDHWNKAQKGRQPLDSGKRNPRVDNQRQELYSPPATSKNTKITHCLKTTQKCKKKILRKKLQQLTGSLEHTSFGIPGGAGLFSPAQAAI